MSDVFPENLNLRQDEVEVPVVLFVLNNNNNSNF